MGEIPVGAVLVDGNGNLLAEAHNRNEANQMPTHHAELLAVEAACRGRGSQRLTDATVYVTLEPCPMCAGAIMNARIKRLVFGARDARAGAYGSVCNINDLPLNHKTEVTAGVLEEECAGVLKDFFKDLRKK